MPRRKQNTITIDNDDNISPKPQDSAPNGLIVVTRVNGKRMYRIEPLCKRTYWAGYHGVSCPHSFHRVSPVHGSKHLVPARLHASVRRLAAPDMGRKAADIDPLRRVDVPVSMKHRFKSFQYQPASTALRHGNAKGLVLRDDPVRDGLTLAYDEDARLPSDRKQNMMTIGGDLSEGMNMWEGEGDLRLDDIVHREEPAYTVTYAKRRGRGKGRNKSATDMDMLEGEYEVIYVEGWESDDDDAISLADGWTEIESWGRTETGVEI